MLFEMRVESPLIVILYRDTGDTGAMSDGDNALPLPADSGDVNVSNATHGGSPAAVLRPLLLDSGRLTVIVCGYVTPAIVLLTVVIVTCVPRTAAWLSPRAAGDARLSRPQ